jgi:hypothetical protein
VDNGQVDAIETLARLKAESGECFDSVHLTPIRREMKRSLALVISGFEIRFKSGECCITKPRFISRRVGVR